MTEVDIKVVFTDLDGTFLNHDGSVSDENKKVFTAAWNAGIPVIPATGRPEFSGIDAIQKVPGFENYTGYPGIFLNGCIVNGMNEKEGKIYTRGVDSRIASLVVTECRLAGLSLVCYSDTGVWYDNDGEECSSLCRLFAQYGEVSKLKVDRQLETLPARGTAYKFCFRGGGTTLTSIKTARKVADVMNSNGGNVIETLPGLFECLPLNVSKGDAVRRFCLAKNILPNEILVLGDANNDSEMLRFGGISVAMENGTSEAKKAAKYRTSSHDTDGFSKALKRFLPARVFIDQITGA